MEAHTVITITPDELSALIASAVRTCLSEMPAQPDGTNRRSGKPRRKMLSAKDIEEEFGISRRMLQSWRLLGLGPPFVNFGKRVFYERTLFEKFAASSQVQTTGCIDR